MEEGSVKGWELEACFRRQWVWSTRHVSLAAAKAEAGRVYGFRRSPKDSYSIYSPDGALHLVSGPGNGWRLKWMVPK